ncbi:MAG: NADH-quinone oxidoreductase subunit I [Myxococcales bacterium]
MAVTVRRVERKEFTFKEQSYLPELFRGMRITNRHFWRNLFGKKETVTIQYPEVRKAYPDRFRGRHRLMLRDDGDVRCVACMLCSTACPANCIHIVAGEHTDKRIEKFPVKFDVDTLVCIYCGFCEEACPCDAIRMDSGRHTMPTFSREANRLGKVDLLSLGTLSTAKQGGENA